MKPSKVNIVGIDYTIVYTDTPSDVDIFRRTSMWGQIDFWTRTIRIYDGGRAEEDIMQSVFHEVLHGIADAMKLKNLQGDGHHDELDILALALVDVLYRNEWMTKA